MPRKSATAVALVSSNAPSGSVEAWAARIETRWQETVEAILDVGRMLIEAKADVGHGNWLKLVAELPFGEDTAQRLMKIAEDEKLANAAHARYLPPSWYTLYELTKLSPGQFEDGIAARLIRPDMDRKDIAAIRARDRHEKSPRRVAPGEAGRVEVRRQDALDFLASIEPASVDLLLTDPPYSTDVPDIAAFARRWLPLALSRVKPTGRAYVFIGAYPHELHAYLDTLSWQADGEPEWRLNVGNILPWTYRNTLGPSPASDYKLNWQACLYLYGPEAPPLDCPSMLEQFTVQEMSAPDARSGIRYHAWQKPDDLAERLIRHASRPLDLVADPFCGTGTFLAAAARLGRRAIGADLDEAMLRICRERGLEMPDAA